MRNLGLVLLLCICNSVYSQLLTPEELIDSGIAMHNEEKYDEAIKLYQQVNENDKKYPLALYETALSFIEKEDYDSALRYINIYLDNNYTVDIEGLIILKGVCYDNLKQYDKAIESYNKILKDYPNSARIIHHIGISYYFQEDKQKAVDYFKKAFYQKSDYTKNLNAMSQLAREGGMLTESILLALHSAFYSLKTSGNESILISLEQLVSEKPIELTKEYTFSKDGDDFKSIDEMLKSQVALQSKYKIDCDFDYPFVKQSHLLLTMLQEYEPSNGYFDTYFVPYYKKIMDDGMFNAFIYTLLVDNTSDKVQPIIKKHINEIKDFIKWSENAMKEINMREFEIDGKKINKTCYFEPEARVCGDIIDGKQEGDWYMFYPNGNLKRTGKIINDKTEGIWTYYDVNGKMNSTYTFKDGKKNGEYKEYYVETGKLKEKGNFENDSLSGVGELYYINGVLAVKDNFKDNKLEGKWESNYKNGKKKSLREYSKGLLNGEAIDYFKDGKNVEIKYTNVDGYAEGNYKEYYRNLTLYKDIEYSKGDYSGKYKEYYVNGNLVKEGIYSNKKLTDVISYHKNGKKENSNELGKDALKVRVEYDYDGVVFAKFYYKDEEVDKVEFYDKEGNVVETRKFGKNDVFEDLWYYTGHTASKGQYKNYKKEGIWNYFSINGVLKREYNFKEGIQEGEQKEYDENGNLFAQYMMKDAELHGDYKTFYEDGTIKTSGIYREGIKNGLWKDFYLDGTLSAENYYFDGEIQGKSKKYDAEGNLFSIYEYDEDELNNIIYYDTDGKEVENYDLNTPKFNEGINTKIEYSKSINERINGDYEGPFIYEVEPGITLREGNYLSSQLNGLYRIYLEDGSIYKSSNYLLDDIEGGDTLFYHNNTPYFISNYKLGREDGVGRKFYANGNIMYERNYVLNDIDGTTTFYSTSGDVIMKKEYKMGFLYYTVVNNESGELVDTIYNKGQKIELVSYHKNGKKAIVETMDKGEGITYKLYNEEEKVVYEYDSDEYGNMKTRNMYYTNGNILSEEKYKFGLKHGDTKYYNEDGSLALVVSYINNQVEGQVNIYKDNQIDKQYVYRLNLPYEKIK